MIGVVDYGLSNMYSLINALKYIEVPYFIAKNPADANNADGLILPGVGAFSEGIKLLKKCGMYSFLKETQKPLLGICLGMQLLFESGEEFSKTQGLGLISGRVTKITGENLKVPHTGWNSLIIEHRSPLFDGLNKDAYMYFVHSYRAEAADKNLLAACEYGGYKICAAAGAGKVFGTQFHPEKSGAAGLTILKNFATICLKDKVPAC